MYVGFCSEPIRTETEGSSEIFVYVCLLAQNHGLKGFFCGIPQMRGGCLEWKTGKR
jgi:hypothetical protein